MGASRVGSSSAGGWAGTPRHYPRSRSYVVISDPEPDEIVALLNGQNSIAPTNPCRPESADPLEVERRMLAVSLEKLEVLISECLDGSRKRFIEPLEPRRRRVRHRCLVRLAAWSATASLASASRRPPSASRWSSRSQTSASKSRNHSRNDRRSSGASDLTCSSICSTLVMTSTYHTKCQAGPPRSTLR